MVVMSPATEHPVITAEPTMMHLALTGIHSSGIGVIGNSEGYLYHQKVIMHYFIADLFSANRIRE